MATRLQDEAFLPAHPKSTTAHVRAVSSFSDDMEQMWAWNETQPTLVYECAHALIKKQVDMQPDATAVYAHDALMSFKQLDDLSTRLAHLLVDLGIEPEDIVPLCFEKSAWAIVGILGVIKAGAAFVFVDPSHPESRREVMMSQVGAKLVISSSQQAALWEATVNRIIIVDQDSTGKLPAHDEAPSTDVTPSNLLYVIFTSGSTGTPKGCLIEHSAFCSGSLQHAARACINSSSRVLQLASFVFDVSILEILTSLISGACICLPSTPAMMMGPAHLINDMAISWAFLTPSLAKMIKPSDIPNLKTLALGGEPLAKIDVETWAAHLQLINGYGPSECSIAATGNTHMTPDTNPANIGWPVGGICWIVHADDHDKLLPIGDVGELLIEGPILARGYLKNQAKTDEVFIERPAWGPMTNAGEVRRLYKTGDLAKFNLDGSIHFVGRKDTQVKLRGLRIELGEIEYHIANHDHIEYKMVILPKTGFFKERLVAVVSLSQFSSSAAAAADSKILLLRGDKKTEADSQILAVRAHLAGRVPEYMVPETWVVLERFPLLISGKLNRSLVQKWITEVDEATYADIADLKFQDGEEADEATALESLIKEIYATVLNLPIAKVRLSRSFLSLGGDSITAMQVMSRCRAAGIALTVKDLLRSTSISELALCAGLAGESIYSKEENFDTDFELSPIQRMYFHLAPETNDATSDTHFNQSFFLQLTRPVSEKDLKVALELLVSQHSMLRVRFTQKADGKWMQRVLPEVAGTYNLATFSVETVQDAAPIVAATQLSLNILEGPVFAANLFQTAKEGQLLLLVAHHVMIDLVSWRTILRDLEEILTTGALESEKPIPFQNWLQLQAQHEAQRHDLSSALPFQIPAPNFEYWGMLGKSNNIGDTVEQRFQLDQESTARLLGEACHTALRTEPLHLLMSALIHSFHTTFPDRQMPALFREGHGREPWDDELDISETVGWFTTMYPLYIEPQNEDDIVQIIKRVKDTSHSVPNNGRPYFASRYLHEAGIKAFGGHEQVEISFDYLGLYQQLERPDALLQQVSGYEATAGDVGRDVPRFSLVEITAEMITGQMQLSFVFNRHMKNQAGLKTWIQTCKESLVSATEKLITLQREYTIADFPLLSLNYDGLDELMSHRLPQVGVSDVESVENIYPCSPMQHGLLIAQSRSANGFYKYYHTMKVETRETEGSVNVSRLEKAWERVVQRHSSLRTVFIESVGDDGLYDQLVLKKITPRIQIYDCEDDRVDEIFDSQDPIAFQSNEAPHRLTLCKSPTGAVCCRLDINHAIVDGASVANIVRDLVLAYDGKISPQPGFLFETYIAYILKHPAASTLNFWVEHLDGIKPCLLPTMALLEDASDPKKQLKSMNVDLRMLPANLTGFCGEHNVTLVNLFQLAWGLVLRAYTDSDDVCFGYLSTGRDVPVNGSIEEGVGAFITMLICRLNLRDAPSLGELLERVADGFIRSLPNQYCDLASIQHALNLAGQPLFNTIISFHRDGESELLEESSIRIEGLNAHDPTEYALAVDVGVSENIIKIELGYWTSDFTDQQVANIGSTFVKALECVAHHTATAFREIDLVSKDHVRQIQAFNAIDSEVVEKCIHDVVQEQIEAQPDAEAICSWEGSWTYRELDEAATKLAHHLVSIGAGPETIIPYCFPKSAWAIVSILAILKSGSAGVALDPGHPAERLRGLAEEVGATIILASPHTAHIFDTFPGAQSVVEVETSLVDDLPLVAQPACAAVRPNNSAFVVFTSGTTGKPKGIVLEHSSMVTCAAAMGPVLDIGPGTRVTQFAAYTFDVSLQDILTTLQRGGTVCVISDHQKMNDLAEGINSTQANWADITSTVASLLRPTDVPTLRRLNNGGEPLTREVVDIWADHVELFNLYGPAETTINHTCSKRLSKDSWATNIGKSYGASVWVVDEHNSDRLVPLGCIGELLIEGPLLARHYLNEPAKTSAAFIENPAWVGVRSPSSTPRRFYKSGDLCSFNTDGSLNIVGRRDGQVKINGQRVELDEIMFQVQSRLATDQQAVIDAIDMEEHARSKTVVAYIYAAEYSQSANDPFDLSIPMSDALSLEFQSLQTSLAASLPRYMIPSVYVPITRVPITQSAKMDRAALRKIVSNFSKEQLSHYMLLNSTRSPPTTEMEVSIQSLWSNVLGVEAHAIGVDDNFFRLGGDSVSAMKLVAAARSRKITVSVADIFASPVLSDMALASKISTNETPVALSLEPFDLIKNTVESRTSILEQAASHCGLSQDAIQDCYPATALQEGLMALSMRRNGAYLAQKVFRILTEDFDISLFQNAWAAVIESEDILRTRIVHTQSLESVQVVLNTSISWMSATDLETYLLEDISTPVQYGGPLMRLAIVKQANGDNYFVWTAHHAVYDGWTVNLLFGKVAKMYSEGTNLPSVPYANFIGHLSEVEPAARDQFWQAQFSSTGSQPTGFPVVPLGYQSTSKQNMTYSGQVPRASSSSFTMPTMMRAAWAVVISTYSDSNDVVFATTLSGRNVPLAGIDTMMGPTITTVPIRIVLPKADVIAEQYLEIVQSQSTEMMPYEQIGLQNIRRLSPEAQKSVDQIQNLLVVQPSEASEDVPAFLDLEEFHRPSTNFDNYALVVECCVGKEGTFDIQARYDDSIISVEIMKRMLQQLEHVLKQLCHSPGTALGQFEPLSSRDLQDIKEWNRVLPDVIDRVVPDQIAEQILQNPDAPAICAWDGTVTYCELDGLSTLLAKHLIALGVGPEVKIGLCFDKSKWNVISMFAVLKAGGVCVQLLPTYPAPRMSSILEDIEASVVLVAPQHSGLFDGIVDHIVRVQDELFSSLPEMDDKLLVSTVQPENCAFIVFTSGSTGKPKGVIIEHRGFCTMTHYQSPRINLGRQARVLQFASHTFDICLFESFSTLICGGCVCIPSEADRMNDLPGAINNLDANWLVLVSTVADTFRPEEVPGVKNVILGGEPLRPDIHARWANSVNLINDYGPAECSILAVMTESKANTPPSMIGKGVGCRTWVTNKDDHNTLMPVGCIGELLVEGPLVARGYLKDPVKTNAAYISSPAWSKHIIPTPMRLYKTGDLVRYDSDGNLHCLGRKDTQIKIRGLRVELGEIEHHIKMGGFHTEHFAVERILQQGDIEKPALAAFIVPETHDSPNLVVGPEDLLLPVSVALSAELARLHDHLGQSLQSFMVPTFYILLRKMPETQTGKTDRKALRQIGTDLSESQLAECSLLSADASLPRSAPATKKEMTLQAAWAEVLDVPRDSIGADDSFFKKGGDSIRAMRLAATVRRVGFTITVLDIFNNPKLCQMAAAAREASTAVVKMNELKPFALMPCEGRDGLIKEAALHCKVGEDSVEDIYPCTPLQEGMIALSLQTHNAYMAQRVFQLPEEMDIERFKSAWQQLVASHPILRTRIIPAKSSGALQIIIREEDISWQEPAILDEYIREDRNRPVGYGSSLTRFAIDAEKRHFIWTAHHALYDGFSANLLFSQLEDIYTGGSISNSVAYTRFIKNIADVDENASASFWKSQLGGGAPISFPQLPTTTYQPQPEMELKRSMFVPRKNENGIMMSTILRTAWAICTAQYMDSNDVVFGATLSGRNAAVEGIEDIVAPTITTVPIRVQLDRAQEVSIFQADVQRRATEMIPFEHTGLQYIHRLGPEVQSALALKNLFVVQQTDGKTVESDFLPEVHDSTLLQGFHTYALVMECLVKGEETIELQAQFDQKVISETQMRRLLAQFEHVVMQLNSTVPGRKVGDIDLFGPGDLEQVLKWNNDTELEVVHDCVHNIFKSQVTIRPEAQAICAWDGSLTYLQLDKLSDRLASYLVSKGVRPETLVPLCFDKSVWTLVTMLAVLKAGGACVHLGITQPITRLAQIISDTGAKVLLADLSHSEMFKGLVEVVTIDPQFLETLPSTDSLPLVKPTDPAFVLFTSGSTGKPKGIVLEHGSLCTSSKAHGTNRKVGPHTRLLQFAAYTFDVSVADIFTTLQRGGCICIPSEEERTNDLAGAINRMNVNYGFLTPTVAGLLEPNAVPGLRTLILGGEMLTQDNIQAWAPALDLIISYGMAECSIHCVDAIPLTVTSNPANLGHSSGCLMWIVDRDDHNKLAPVGCVGELVIEGRMVARGYLNDKAKTDAAFIEDPAWALPGAKPRRMYKTGDLAKYSDDGEICYVSRTDFQVKHHGQRIELGEIEHHLLTDSHVRHAVALLPKSGYSQNRLVGVLSLHAFTAPTGPVTEIQLVSGLRKGIAELQLSSIRSFLAATVPDYMVPAIWIIVDAIPLTANGKMDRVRTRQWLEEMDETTFATAMNGNTQDGSDVAATHEEEQVQKILSKVLGLPTINLNRSFLDLGGDSIGAMQLKAKCHAEDIELTIRDILTCKSISELTLKATFGVSLKAHLEEVVEAPFALTPFQQMYFEITPDYQPYDDHNHLYNQCLLLRLETSITVYQLARAIEGVVQRHSMLRARFTGDDENGWTQEITKEVSQSYRFEAHAVTGWDQMIDELLTCQSALNIISGPVFAVHLFNVEDDTEVQQQYLFLSAHPLIADMESLHIIVHDLEQILVSKTPLTQKPLSFQTWTRLFEEQAQATSKREVLSSSKSTSSFDYWGMDGLVNVFGDAVEECFTLNSKTTSLLLGASNNALRTEPVDILLSAIIDSFKTSFKNRAIPVISCKGQGRKVWDEKLDLSDVVGCFTSLNALHVLGDEDVVRILRQVKDSRVQSSNHGSMDSDNYVGSPSTTAKDNQIPAGRSHLEILFEYNGHRHGNENGKSLFHFESVPKEQIFGKSTKRHALLEVSAEIEDGAMSLRFIYNRQMHHQDEIKDWIQGGKKAITHVTHRLQDMEVRNTLSDFPLLPMNYAQLEELEETLSKIGLISADVTSVFPCSPIQYRMLQSQRRTPGTYQSDTWHSIKPSLGTGAVDIRRMQAAWQRVTDRHEALRTIFMPSIVRPGEFDQILLKERRVDVQLIECEDSQMLETLEHHAAVDYTASQPHSAFTLFRGSSNNVYCKLEISHALQDGMSTRVIYRDLVMAYENTLPSEPTPGFQTYVSWLHKQDLNPSVDYWTKHLEDVRPCCLPHQANDRSIVGRTNNFIPIAVPEPITSHLPDFCKTNGLTMATVFQTAWALVLRSFTRSTDIVFGYMTANRDVPIPAIADMVGPLINMLLCRLDIEDQMPLSRLLNAVAAEFSESVGHQYGFVEAVQRTLDQSALPVWNTVMSLEYAGEEGAGEASLAFETLGGTRSPEFDVVIGVLIRDHAIEAQLGYWDHCITAAYAEELARAYVGFLGLLLSREDRTVGESGALI